MFCPHCGNEIKIQGQRFCSFCGADLTKPAISAEKTAPTQTAPAPQATSQPQMPPYQAQPTMQQQAPAYQLAANYPPQAPAYQQPAYHEPTQDPFSVEDPVQPEKKKGFIGTIILSSMLVLLLVGIIIFVVVSGKRAEQKEAALHADAMEAEYREGDLLYEDENIIITIGEISYDNDYYGTGDNFFEIDLLIHNKRDDNIVIETGSAKVGDNFLSTDHCYCHLGPGEDGVLRIYKRQFDLDEIDSISFSLTGTGNVTITENGHSWNKSNRFVIIPVTIEFDEPMHFD